MLPSPATSAPLSVAEQGCTVCELCARRFSTEAQFCPFDGARLLADQVFPPDPLVGQVVDERYCVKYVLGEGGMGIVYEVRHEKLGRPLALKVLRHDLAQEESLCRRFIQEARAAATVGHPGVVQIMDFGALTTGQPYFVMELLRGQSLARAMRDERPFGIDRMLNITEQLVDALDAAHRAAVVHRDLKPDNIQLITDARGRECVKVLDFGLARVGGASRLTKQGFVFGTPHYMSPEQALGDDVDHRADIYALGVLMYEMTTGQLPFDADSYMGVLTQHIQTPPVRPNKLLQGYRLGALETVILKCLEKKPQRRYDSMAAVARDLRVAVRRTPEGLQLAPRRALLTSISAYGPASSLPKPRVWLLAGLGAATTCAAGSWVVSRWLGSEQHPVRATPTLSTAVEPRRFVQAASTTEPPVGPQPSASRPNLDKVVPTGAQDPAHPPPQRANSVRGTSPHRVPTSLPTTEIIDPWADSAPR